MGWVRTLVRLHWADLGGLQFHLLSDPGRPEKHKVPTNGPYHEPPGLSFVHPALFFEPDPFPELAGPTVDPEGQKSAEKPGAGFILSSSLKSA